MAGLGSTCSACGVVPVATLAVACLVDLLAFASPDKDLDGGQQRRIVSGAATILDHVGSDVEVRGLREVSCWKRSWLHCCSRVFC